MFDHQVNGKQGNRSLCGGWPFTRRNWDCPWRIRRRATLHVRRPRLLAGAWLSTTVCITTAAAIAYFTITVANSATSTAITTAAVSASAITLFAAQSTAPCAAAQPTTCQTAGSS